MPTYSTQFFSGILAANVLEHLYTVPAASVVVVRDIEVYVGGNNDLFNIQIGTPGGTIVFWALPVASAPSWHQWEGRTVIPAGESLMAYSALGNLQLTVSGYLLSD